MAYGLKACSCHPLNLNSTNIWYQHDNYNHVYLPKVKGNIYVEKYFVICRPVGGQEGT